MHFFHEINIANTVHITTKYFVLWVKVVEYNYLYFFDTKCDNPIFKSIEGCIVPEKLFCKGK